MSRTDAIHCVSFSKHCVAEEVTDVPQLFCCGTQLIFFSSFTNQVLEQQSSVRINATVTSVDGLGTEAKD